MPEIGTYEYTTLKAIATRMRWGKRRVLEMIRNEDFPARKLGRDYITTEPLIRKWLDKKLAS